MALTLPYPSMDFVPLDILTASELDQMVANIEYIASGSVFPLSATNIASNAITTPKIADNAVTSSKIDFTTFTDDNGNIRKIYSYTVDGTTDSNGFVSIPTTAIAPDDAIIIGARSLTVACFVSPFNDVVSNRYTIRCDNYAWSAVANTAVSIEVLYIKA